MNTLLLIYSIYAKIMITLMGVYIYKLRKKVKKYELGPIGYMCSTDYSCELSWNYEDPPGTGVGVSVEVHDSLNGVKKRSCADECGITKVQLVKLEEVTKPDFSKLTRLKS
jgi:hypothetical protein